MRNMIRAVLFDADNTFYDSRESARRADLAAMKYLSKLCGADQQKLFKEWMLIVKGVKKSKSPEVRHRKYSYSLLLKEHGADEKISEEMYEIFFENFLRRIKLFRNVAKTLGELKEMGLTLVIVSEDFREQLEKKMKSLGIENFFDLVVTCDDVGVMKPDKKYYDVVRSSLKIPFEDILAVGDSFEKDLEMPKKLKMKTVLVFGKDGRSGFSINDFGKIVSIVKSLMST